MAAPKMRRHPSRPQSRAMCMSHNDLKSWHAGARLHDSQLVGGIRRISAGSSFALLMLALAAAAAAGQTPARPRTVGLGAGLALQSDTRNGYQSFPGPVASGNVTGRFIPRIGGRAEALLAR